MMLRKAWDCIKVNKMIEKGDRIVVGVSGGADSVCLLYVLKEYCSECGAQITAVHINHGIRGEEALRDEQFVGELCSNLNIEYRSFTFSVKKIAKEQGLSEEEAGRMIRYESFLDICRSNKCNKIAIAHNRNDNAETVLFHLFRGAGMRGLSGIEPKRFVQTDFGDVTIIRPLLYIERNEIEKYLIAHNIPWQTDSTNLTDDYSRNKIRNRILAYAQEEINSASIANITEAASQLREAGDFIDLEVKKAYSKLVEQDRDNYRLGIDELKDQHVIIQKGLVFRILEQLAGRRKDIEGKHIDAVLSLLQKQVGRSCQLPYHIVVEREYEHIRFYCSDDQDPILQNPCAIPLKIPGKTLIPWNHKICETVLINYKNTVTIPKSSCVKWFDYDKIENAVNIRTREDGDYIQINSLGGHKKLKNYFIDQKIPRKLRDHQLLVADGSHIMWIAGDGDRMSERYKVDENTKRVLLMKMYELEENVDDK